MPTARPGTGYAFARSHDATATSPSRPSRRSPSCRPEFASPSAASRSAPPGLPHAATSSGLDDALDAFAWDLDARDDLHATARYRRDLVRRIGREVVQLAVRDRDRRTALQEAA